MTIRKVQIKPPDNSYGDIIHPETDHSVLLMASGNSLATDMTNKILQMGLNAELFNGKKLNEVKMGYGVTTNVGNNYSVAPDMLPAAYYDGYPVTIKVNVDSTGPCTLNINSLGAKAIKKANGTDIINLKANGVYTLRYNSTTGNFILQGEGGSGNASASDLALGKTATTDAGDIVGTLDNLPFHMRNALVSFTKEVSVSSISPRSMVVVGNKMYCFTTVDWSIYSYDYPSLTNPTKLKTFSYNHNISLFIDKNDPNYVYMIDPYMSSGFVAKYDPTDWNTPIWSCSVGTNYMYGNYQIQFATDRIYVGFSYSSTHGVDEILKSNGSRVNRVSVYSANQTSYFWVDAVNGYLYFETYTTSIGKYAYPAGGSQIAQFTNSYYIIKGLLAVNDILIFHGYETQNSKMVCASVDTATLANYKGTAIDGLFGYDNFINYNTIDTIGDNIVIANGYAFAIIDPVKLNIQFMAKLTPSSGITQYQIVGDSILIFSATSYVDFYSIN